MTHDLREKGYWSSEHCFSAELVRNLYVLAQSWEQNGRFSAAKIGRGDTKSREETIRGDSTCWVDDFTEHSLAEYHGAMVEMTQRVRQECYLPVRNLEAHFAIFPENSFYSRHRDRHQTVHGEQAPRLLTCVLYLSPWKAGCGGELLLHPETASSIEIRPLQGNFVIFDSEMEHEVTKTLVPRWSLTAWLRG